MSNHAQRLRALEHTRIRRLLTEAGQPYGLSADDLLETAREIFALIDSPDVAALEASPLSWMRRHGRPWT